MKKILKLLVVAALCVATLLCVTSCGEDEPSYADYKISVVDFMGNPISNVVATFTDVDGNTKKTITSKDGTANFKNFTVGKNSVLLEKGLSDADIMQERYTFAEGVTEMRIVLRNEKTSVGVVGEIEDGQYAYPVGVGSHKVLTEANHTSYVIFNAPSTGIYKVSFNSADTEMTVGYYGGPMYVQNSHRSDGEYDGKSFELVIQDAGTPYVIGLNCKSTTDSTLIIERKGDAPFDPQFAQGTTVNATEDFKYYTTCVLDKLIVETSTSIIEYAITAVTVETVGIGYNGTYLATAEGGDTKNIKIEDGSITIDGKTYKYSIKNGIPQILDDSNEPLNDLKLSVSGNLTDLDVSDASLSVSKGDDGYYYAKDGKRVYVRIGSASSYLDASLALLAGYENDNVGINIGGYVYDESGNFEGKYSYNEMIGKYYEYSDANGVYPLTEELIEAIKLHGNSTGWWNPDAANFLFAGKPYVAENAWLFLCCTVD